MMRLIWSDTAKADYLKLLAYIANESPQNSVLVQNRINKSVTLLPDFRLGQTLGSSQYFSYYIPKTSYFVVYKVTSDEVIVLIAFVHSARNWMRLYSGDETDQDIIDGIKQEQDESKQGRGISHHDAMTQIRTAIAKSQNVGRPTSPETP